MAILFADLDNDSYERVEENGLEGLELGISLFTRFYANSPLIIASPSADSLRFSGSAVFTFVYRSPISGRMTFSYSSYAPGVSMRRLGYDAIVIMGKARSLSYLSIGPDGAERVIAGDYRAFSSERFEKSVKKGIGENFLSVGRAAENGVKFASLQSGGREIPGDGLGYVLGSKNLKGLSFPDFSRKDLLGNGKDERKARRWMERSLPLKKLRSEGGGTFVDSYLSKGAVPIMNYSMRFDPRAYFVDGISFTEKYGMYPESCQDCFYACARRRQDNTMLPTWREVFSLGTNLGIFDPENVAKIADAAREEGLSSAHLGAILASLTHERNVSVERSIDAIHAIGEGRALFGALKDIPGGICTEEGESILLDLRGSYPDALMTAYGLPVDLFASALIPKKPLSIECSAILALYESVYFLALISEGFSPMGAISEWWGKFPSYAYYNPQLLRLIARTFRAYGMKSSELQAKGLRLMNEFMKEPERLPKAFTLNVSPVVDDGRTVPCTQLFEAFELEKASLERIVRSRSEKRQRPKASKSTAVGPEEERGREGEPGLTI